MSESQSGETKAETLEQALVRIKELEAQNSELQSRLTFDKLTGEFGVYREEAAKEKAMKFFLENNFPLAGVIRMDMKNMKQVNDDYDHDVGNLAIKDFGKFLSETVKAIENDPEIKGAFAFRVHEAGDEFGLFVPGTSMERIDEITQAMKDRAPLFKIQEKEVELAFTAGCAATDEPRIKEELETLRWRSREEKAAVTWNVLNSFADFDERMFRKVEKSQTNG